MKDRRRVRLDSLKPHPDNPNRHPERNLEMIGGSLETFEQDQDIVVQKSTGYILKGEGRWLAMQRIGWKEADVTYVDDDDEKARARMVADNRTAETSERDNDTLLRLLQELQATNPEMRGAAGYSEEELLALLQAKEDPKKLVDVEAPPVPKTPHTKPGDTWVLGDHRVHCLDTTNAGALGDAIQSPADLLVTDPPWNVAYGSRDNPKWKARTIKNDDLGKTFPAFLQAAFQNVATHLRGGAQCYVVMSSQEWPAIHATLTGNGWHWSSTIIWVKDRHVLSRKDYHTRYEPIWYGWREDAPRLHPLKNRTTNDVWEIPRPNQSNEHPTMKPIALMAQCITDASKPGAHVFDPFIGSGTTLIAAEQLRRRCTGIDIDPGYCDVTAQRWSILTGRPAILHRPGEKPRTIKWPKPSAKTSPKALKPKPIATK